MARGVPIIAGDRVRQRRGRLDGSARSIPIIRDDDRALWILVLGLAGLIVVWVGAVFTVEQARFVVLVPSAQAVGVEAASALARLFAALVLLLFQAPRTEPRLQWVAGGFLVLGLGSLVFGYLYPLLTSRPNLDTSMYASLVAWSLAGAFFVAGLLPAEPPRLSGPVILTALVVFAALCLAMVAGVEALPPLVSADNLEAAARSDHAILPGLTGWHWALSVVPLGLAVLAVVGAARHLPAAGMRVWIVMAMVLLAGSQLHNLFWPAAYRPILTTGNLLRLAFGAIVAVGGVLELRRVAAERAALLAAEQESTQRLADLAVLKADFTAMVAHELGSPIAAVRRSAELLATEPLTPTQARAVTTIEAATDTLDGLVADVQTAATVERDDFAVHIQSVPVDVLLDDAVAFAQTLPGDHPLTVEVAAHERVRADPGRIAQVLRNLLSNAAKYSPSGAPIALRAIPQRGCVRIEVVDHGYGIHSDDMVRIFEKFGRGRDQSGQQVAGIGLGLYLSRRIVQAHGTELTVDSTPGVGSIFGFALEVAR